MLTLKFDSPPEKGIGMVFKLEGESLSDIDDISAYLVKTDFVTDPLKGVLNIPIVIDEIGKMGYKASIKFYGSIKAKFLNFSLFLLNNTYKRNKQQYVKIFHLEVPNE